MDLKKEIKGLEEKYNRSERLMKLYKSLEFVFTWILPFLFLILVFGHQYGAIFLVPMVIICVPGRIICEGLKQEKHGKMLKIWSKIGDLERNEHDPENENG